MRARGQDGGSRWRESVLSLVDETRNVRQKVCCERGDGQEGQYLLHSPCKLFGRDSDHQSHALGASQQGRLTGQATMKSSEDMKPLTLSMPRTSSEN